MRVDEMEDRENTLPFPLWRVMFVKVVEVKDEDWQFVEEREIRGALVRVIERMYTDVQTRCPSPTLSNDEDKVAVVEVE